MEVCHLLCLFIVVCFSPLVTSSSQDDVAEFVIDPNGPARTRMNLDAFRNQPGKNRKMDARPGMVPERQMKKPEELMSRDEYKVTKLKEQDSRYRYGGQTVPPTPTELTVTDEVFFELEMDNFEGSDEPVKGNITIACFGGLTPITCLNFVSITKGFRKGKNRMSYKNGKVSKVVRDFMIQLGDTNDGNNDSIFGKKFADESFAISHNRAGWVGMANFGQDSNGSQFYVLLRTARWLDGKHVAFGKVIKGMNIIQKIGEQDTDVHNAPLKNIKISDCGSLNLESPYVLTESQFNTDGDIERREGDEL